MTEQAISASMVSETAGHVEKPLESLNASARIVIAAGLNALVFAISYSLQLD